jgi:hypothetical protein
MLINKALNQLANRAQIMAHSAVLFKAEVQALQNANQAKKRRARKHKRHIMHGGSLTIEESRNLADNTAIEAQIR